MLKLTEAVPPLYAASMRRNSPPGSEWYGSERPGGTAASGLAVGGERLEQVVAGYRATGGHDARGDGCQDGESDRLAVFLHVPDASGGH
jgi:hypothetical protein